MSITRLPNGRLRVQVYDPATKKNVSAAVILGLSRKDATFEDTKAGRRRALVVREEARGKLAQKRPHVVTLKAFADRWTNDPLFARPKESTNRHNAERIGKFVDKYGTIPIANVTDDIVQEWIVGGSNLGSVPALKAMFNDAMSVTGGRLITLNPFAGIKIAKRSRALEAPPAEDVVWAMIRSARKVASPEFAAWLQVACFTGMRPGELDGLRWERVDFTSGRIDVIDQFNGKTKTFTTPKNGNRRDALLTPQAREALMGQPRSRVFCFENLRGQHFTPSSRAYHWKAVRAAAGWDKSLYLATRHFFGWYAVNVLHLDSEDVAIAMGHTDGGALVRSTYGHRSHKLALDRVDKAFAAAGNVRPLRAVQ